MEKTYADCLTSLASPSIWIWSPSSPQHGELQSLGTNCSVSTPMVLKIENQLQSPSQQIQCVEEHMEGKHHQVEHATRWCGDCPFSQRPPHQLPLIAFVHVSTCHGTIIRENITIATFQLHAHAHGNTSHLNKSNALFPGGSVDPSNATGHHHLANRG